MGTDATANIVWDRFRSPIEVCDSKTHKDEYPPPFAQWLVTWGADGGAYECEACFQWRITWLLRDEQLTVIRIRGESRLPK